jgi:hypothetical protein
MILIPTINPIRFSLSGVNEPKVENAFYRDYYQKFQRTDVTKIQILIPEDEPQNWALSAVKIDDEAISYDAPKFTFDDKVDNHLVVEYSIDFSQFPEGKYRFFLQSGNGLKYSSDIICVKNTHEYTRLLSYCNTYNDQGVAFSTGVVFHLRVESQLYKAVIPKSEDSIYNNNLGGYRMLNSSPYDNYRLNIGGTAGIPDWLMRIINQAFSCDTLFLNNVEITKADGATFEPTEQDNYNLRSWNIEIGHIENSLFYEEHLLTVNGEQQLVLNISRNPQAIPIIVFATATWEVVGNYPKDWITVTPAEGGANGDTVTLVFTGNTKTIARSSTVFFRLKGMHALTVEINVVQEGTVISSVIWSSFVLTLGQEYEAATMLKAVSTALGIERTYNLLAAFGTYPAITVKQWQEMSPELLLERIAAFKTYINALEVIEIDEIQANDVLRTALKIRMLGSGGMLMNDNNLRISI